MPDISDYRTSALRPNQRDHPMTLLPEPVSERFFTPVISADDHVLEPYDLFTARVPSAMRDAVPHVHLDADGVPWWLIDDARVQNFVLNGAVGRPMAEWDLAPQRYEEFRPGVTDVGARLRDMDLDGVWGSVTFPSMIFGFAGTLLDKLPDAAVGLACVRAYNDWLAEEFIVAAPGRFVPSQLPWFCDPVLAAAEIRRNAARGFRAVSFSENPAGLGFPSIHTDHWDPFYAACEDTGTVVNLHVGSSGNVQHPSPDGPMDTMTALFPVNGMLAAVDWIYARVPLLRRQLCHLPAEVVADVCWRNAVRVYGAAPPSAEWVDSRHAAPELAMARP